MNAWDQSVKSAVQSKRPAGPPPAAPCELDEAPERPSGTPSVEGRLLARLLEYLGNPPLEFILWTGERIAPPGAAIEGLAAARPVIAFAVGGLPEVVIDGVNGRLVPPGDCEAFAQAVIDTLGNPARRASYARGAAASAQGFSVDAHVQRLVDCYRMTLAP